MRKHRFTCKQCGDHYKVLGKNDMCFFCDFQGWKKAHYVKGKNEQ